MFLGEIFRGIQVCFRSQGGKNTIRENLKLKHLGFDGLFGDVTNEHLFFGFSVWKTWWFISSCFFFRSLNTSECFNGRYSRWLLRTAGGGEMRSHFILFDDFETSDLACFIIPVEFFFLQIPRGICPCCFFSGGVEKNTFFERWQDKTHTFWRKYQRFLTKRSLFERLGLTIWSCLFFFDSKKSSFTMLIHKQSLRSKIFCLPGVTRTEHTLFSLWKKHTLQRLAGNLRPIFWKQHKLYPGCQRLFEV